MRGIKSSALVSVCERLCVQKVKEFETRVFDKEKASCVPKTLRV